MAPLRRPLSTVFALSVLELSVFALLFATARTRAE